MTKELISEFSLTHLMESRVDFANELTQLQAVAKGYGVEVVMTPKYHAEIAGVGIEYAWGAAKSHYRWIPFSEKRSKEGFKKAVSDSLGVLGKPTIRKCNRKLRIYIMAYYAIEVMEAVDEQENQNQIVLTKTIEKFQRLFKTHHAAVDFDQAFCASLVLSSE